MSLARSFKWTISMFGIAGFAGLGALMWGQSRPVYRVPYAEASVAFMKWCTAEPNVDLAAGERYLAMFADRYAWLDFGFGMVTTALAGMLLIAILYFRRSEESWLRTPSKGWHFLVAGWAVIGWFCCSAIYSLITDFNRQQFPWCADSMGIPIFGTLVSSTILLIAGTLAGLFLIACFEKLPVSLLQWDPARPTFSWSVTVLAGLMAVVILLLMIDDVALSMSIANPAGLIAIYLLASTRAALVAQKPSRE